MTQRGMRQQTRQLAFVWGEEGEALFDPGKGPPPPRASDQEGALTGELMEAIAAVENLGLAMQRVRANKGSPGVDGRSVEQLPAYLEDQGPELRVNREKSGVDRAAKRKFLGLRVIGRGEKARLSIAPESRARVKKELRRITKRNRGVSRWQVLTELGRYTDGWVGYFWVARTPSVFRELDQWLRRRLRCYQWKQWKRPRTRAKGLLAAGVGRYLAWGTAYGDRVPWRVAGSPAMNQALTNAALQRLGFRSLLERYHSLVTH